MFRESLTNNFCQNWVKNLNNYLCSCSNLSGNVVIGFIKWLENSFNPLFSGWWINFQYFYHEWILLIFIQSINFDFPTIIIVIICLCAFFFHTDQGGWNLKGRTFCFGFKLYNPAAEYYRMTCPLAKGSGWLVLTSFCLHKSC